MITKVNDIDLKVLSLFTNGYNKEYYIREVEHLLSISSRTALITLAKLETIGILNSKMRGKIKLYAYNSSIIAREYSILAEQYKKIHFLECNTVIKEIIEKLEPCVNGMVVIFGSYAKGLQKKDSDLDICIAGSCDKVLIEQIGKRYGIEINIKQYPLDIFTKYLRETDDILIKEVIEHHVLINNAEAFVTDVAKWIK